MFVQGQVGFYEWRKYIGGVSVSLKSGGGGGLAIAGRWELDMGLSLRNRDSDCCQGRSWHDL